VTISMVSAGIIDRRRTMPIPIWAHVGASLLVMLVAVNLRIGASYIIASEGLAIYPGIGVAELADRHDLRAGGLLPNLLKQVKLPEAGSPQSGDIAAILLRLGTG
jgi:hypothetical protein